MGGHLFYSITLEGTLVMECVSGYITGGGLFFKLRYSKVCLIGHQEVYCALGKILDYICRCTRISMAISGTIYLQSM